MALTVFTSLAVIFDKTLRGVFAEAYHRAAPRYTGRDAMLLPALIALALIPPQSQIATRVDALLAKMTLEEKVSLCHGGSSFATAAIPRLGIPAWWFTDGPAGVRGQQGEPTTYFPTGTSLASTWNPDLAKQEGQAIGQEVKADGKGMILGPAINIIRTPLGGRSFEYMTEDPYLDGQIAAGYVQGVQSQGVGACVKHFAANSEEDERGSVDCQVDERTLREIYLPGFETAIKKGGALAVMAAYNKLNGQHCAENKHLLTEVLKDDWGFKGFVMSDWGAVHSTVPTALNGLDLEMPGDSDNFLGAPLLQAVKDGQVPESVIDEKVRRILTAMISVGYFDHPNGGSINTPSHQTLARKIADESIVLLKNKREILPLDASDLRSVAVIGPNADVKQGPGGGSSAVYPPFEITPLQGIKDRLGPKVKVTYCVGSDLGDDWTDVPSDVLAPDQASTKHGLKGEYFKGQTWSGQPQLSRVDPQVRFRWNRSGPSAELGKENYSVRWTGFLTPEKSGTYKIGTWSDDGSTVYIDGKLVVDNGGLHAMQNAAGTVDLEAGHSYPIRIDYFQGIGEAGIVLVWNRLPATRSEKIDEAVAAAKASDVAILVVGTNHQWDTEGSDKPNLELMGDQADLIQAVAQANPRTVVVLVNGSAVVMDPWLEQVPAVIEAWYPGMEGGAALADILFGDVDPSGRLAETFPRSEKDSPPSANGDYPPKNGVLRYDEGILVGYRYFDTKHVAPLFPFGYGLSYTTFSYHDLRVEPHGDGCRVTFSVRNDGKRQGKEVAQIYISDSHAPVLRPEKELKGFDKVDLAPGQSKKVTIDLDQRAFAYWSVKTNGWTVDPGQFQVLVGASSRDIRLHGEFDYPSKASSIARPSHSGAAGNPAARAKVGHVSKMRT